MKSSMILFAVGSILCMVPACAFAETLREITVQVVDEDGEPVEGAEVRARYLANVRQGAKEHRFPMELSRPQTTDTNGQCKLVLREVAWSLAAIKAVRPEMKVDEALKLHDKAPREPLQREAFEREIDDRLERCSTAFQQLTPSADPSQPITLKMKKSVRVTGRIRVSEQPLPKAFVTIYSPKTQIDRLFARSSPVLTDQEGRFSFYAIPGKLNQAKIVVERESGKRVLQLAEVTAKPTPAGLMFDIDTVASDYVME
ncbi:MAG: hypothetical protein ACPHJ3_20565 [Rubripirellula sp.]